ncbi:MAG: hypothetical protein KKA31_02775 [Candidatus Margulisbacteria bacterium]|nr:hypothetical protein [Candidatus Margulisiibacteriota bacterium]
MINFEQQDFQKTVFSSEQLAQYLASARHDLDIARDSDVPDVVFKFSYDVLLKIGIYLIAKAGYKVRATAGHHFKILEKLSQILEDENISVLGNKMRQERNIGLYSGGFSVSQKDSREYLDFVGSVFARAAD